MSNKTAAATTVATGATLTEDVTTPPPSYEEHANTTPGALVQSEPQTPAVAATAAATESDVARAASAPVEAAAEPAPLGQTERYVLFHSVCLVIPSPPSPLFLGKGRGERGVSPQLSLRTFRQ